MRKLVSLQQINLGALKVFAGDLVVPLSGESSLESLVSSLDELRLIIIANRK